MLCLFQICSNSAHEGATEFQTSIWNSAKPFAHNNTHDIWIPNMQSGFLHFISDFPIGVYTDTDLTVLHFPVLVRVTHQRWIVSATPCHIWMLWVSVAFWVWHPDTDLSFLCWCHTRSVSAVRGIQHPDNESKWVSNILQMHYPDTDPDCWHWASLQW